MVRRPALTPSLSPGRGRIFGSALTIPRPHSLFAALWVTQSRVQCPRPSSPREVSCGWFWCYLEEGCERCAADRRQGTSQKVTMKENSVRLWLRKGCGVLVVNALLLGMLGAPEATRAENTRHTDGRGTVKLVIPAPGGGAVAKGREGAEEFLVAHQSEFKLPGDLANLEWVSKHESLLGTHYRYRQMLNAVPVDGADVVVSVGRDSGEVYQAYNNTYPVEVTPAAPGKVMGEEAALDAAWQHLRVHGPLLGEAQAGLVYLPEKGGFRLAYKTYVPVAAPKGYWEHRIDAVTGEVLGVRDTAINESKRARQLPDFGAYSGAVWSREEARRQWELARRRRGRARAFGRIR